VTSTGRLGGYAWGLDVKKSLLTLEARAAEATAEGPSA
jgi:O6-methylguanine-DNA--protein-cysteine methyltransferase